VSTEEQERLARRREGGAQIRESRRRSFELAEKARALGPRVIAACARALIEPPPPDSVGFAPVMLLRLLLVEASQSVVREIEREIDGTHSSLGRLVGAEIVRRNGTAPKLELPDVTASFGRVLDPTWWLSLPLFRERLLVAALEVRVGRDLRVAFMMFGYRLAAWFEAEHAEFDQQLSEKIEARGS